MRAEMAAVRAALEPLGYAVNDGAATTAQAMPYLILGAPAWAVPDEVPMSGATGDVDAEVRVKAVAANADAVRAVLARVRSTLSPDLRWRALTVGGRVAQTKFVRSEFVDVDETTTLTSGSHPTQGVDTYRLTSQPT